MQKSSFSSSSSGAAASTQVKSILKQPASVKHGEEIQQESLKTTIQSAITDIEQGIISYPTHRWSRLLIHPRCVERAHGDFLGNSVNTDLIRQAKGEPG